MVKKKEENLVATKVELKTPIAKKKEIFDEVIEDSLKQMGKDTDNEIFQNGNVGMGDSPTERITIDTKAKLGLNVDSPKEKLFISSENMRNLGIGSHSSEKLHVTGEVEILQFEKLGLLDSIQTIERSKIDLIKECIENSQTLEAIVLLQQLQTGEQWKIQEIIQSLS